MSLESIPQFTLQGVFLYLPSKDILKSREVCSQWRQIVSEPTFLKNWLVRNGLVYDDLPVEEAHKIFFQMFFAKNVIDSSDSLLTLSQFVYDLQNIREGETKTICLFFHTLTCVNSIQFFAFREKNPKPEINNYNPQDPSHYLIVPLKEPKSHTGGYSSSYQTDNAHFYYSVIHSADTEDESFKACQDEVRVHELGISRRNEENYRRRYYQ